MGSSQTHHSSRISSAPHKTHTIIVSSPHHHTTRSTQMASVNEVRRAQYAEGPATIFAIATAVPSFSVEQSEYPDYYFKVTNSEHKTKLKEKFKRICDRSQVRKRYFHLTEDNFQKNPNLSTFMSPSLDARHDAVVSEVPKLGKEAALKAIKEWGLPKSKITHLIFCTSSGVSMPGADYHLAKLLGLGPSVKRLMFYLQGCFAGGTVLRVAKDLAENDKDARVLIVCSETTALTFHGPSETLPSILVGQALFGDGAAAVIVGSDPIPKVEKPLFEIVSSSQKILPDSDGAIDASVRESGLVFCLSEKIPEVISKNIETSLVEDFHSLGIEDWNSLFWVVHPGGPKIVDAIEAKLELKPEKLQPTRHMLSEYGNMESVSVIFILDEIRRSSTEKRLEWGVLLALGPGITVETVVLRNIST